MRRRGLVKHPGDKASSVAANRCHSTSPSLLLMSSLLLVPWPSQTIIIKNDSSVENRVSDLGGEGRQEVVSTVFFVTNCRCDPFGSGFFLEEKKQMRAKTL